MMENVPGAIYRSAWHADYALELISDEIERISGYPAANFLASRRRTLMSIIHPDDPEVRPLRPDPAVEKAAMDYVMAYEVSQDRDPEDVSQRRDGSGFNIRSVRFRGPSTPM
jgi:hypothetical protein